MTSRTVIKNGIALVSDDVAGSLRGALMLFLISEKGGVNKVDKS